MSWKPDYVSVDDLKRHLRIPGLYAGSLNTSEDTYDDIPLQMAIATASRLIDLACNRQFGITDVPTAFYYTPTYDRELQRFVVKIDDLMTTDDMVVSYRAGIDSPYDQTTTDVTLYPINALAQVEPWTLLAFDTAVPCDTNSVKIEANFGWTEVPTTIKQATLIQAARIFKRRDAAFGVAGSPELGNELRLLAKVDADVQVVLLPYIKYWGAV